MEVVENTLVIRPASSARKGWEEQIALAAKADNSKDRLPDFFKDENMEDWTW
jgi:hypothetical protein